MKTSITQGSFICECAAPKFEKKSDGKCGNANECEKGTAQCPPNSICVDKDALTNPLGYDCECISAGYQVRY